MSDIMQTLYGPLDKDYCLYFLVFSIIGFLLLVLGAISVLIYGITKKEKISFYFLSMVPLVAYFLMYLQNRILYQMCIGNMR